MSDPRHPYTHAYDFIRLTVGHDANGDTKLSRGDCARIMALLAEHTDVDVEAATVQLSEAFMRRNNLPQEV